MDSSLPGSSAHGIFQARILGWVAISFSRGSSRPKNRTQVSRIAGSFFTNWATQEALGIAYYLHCAWRPQSSWKVEKANQFLKSEIRKIIQETSLGWKEALPISLLHTCIAPKEQVGLTPYEILYERPFVYVNDLFLDPEAQPLQSYTMAIGQFQQDIHLWDVNQDPKDSKEAPLYSPET